MVDSICSYCGRDARPNNEGSCCYCGAPLRQIKQAAPLDEIVQTVQAIENFQKGLEEISRPAISVMFILICVSGVALFITLFLGVHFGVPQIGILLGVIVAPCIFMGGWLLVYISTAYKVSGEMIR